MRKGNNIHLRMNNTNIFNIARMSDIKKERILSYIFISCVVVLFLLYFLFLQPYFLQPIDPHHKVWDDIPPTQFGNKPSLRDTFELGSAKLPEVTNINTTGKLSNSGSKSEVSDGSPSAPYNKAPLLTANYSYNESNYEDEASQLGNDICGMAAIEKLGLKLIVRRVEHDDQSIHGINNGIHQSKSYVNFIVESNQPDRDIQLSGRAISILDSVANDVNTEVRRVMIAATITRIDQYRWNVRFGPVPCIVGDGNYANDIMASQGGIPRRYHYDIIATWVGTKYLGQRWYLPPRDDNSSKQNEMKKKCKSLKLVGNCDRFGVTLLSSYGGSDESAFRSWNGTKGHPPLILECITSCKLPKCRSLRDRDVDRGSELFDRSGVWLSTALSVRNRNIYSNETNFMNEYNESSYSPFPSVLDQRLLSDYVGLNTFLGSDWRWVPSCRTPLSHIYYNQSITTNPCTMGLSTKIDEVPANVTASLNPPVLLNPSQIATCFSKQEGQVIENGRPIRLETGQTTTTVALIGDSMILEQFYMLAAALEVPVSNITEGKTFTRWKEFIVSVPLNTHEIPASFDGTSALSPPPQTPSSHRVNVRFFRGYNTLKGRSVVSSVETVINQLRSIKPDIIIGNLASLHWQQNMESLDTWKAYVVKFKKYICKSLRSSSPKRSPIPVVFWGHTQIHMGRTQGLNPSRTEAFNRIARDILLGNVNMKPAKGVNKDVSHDGVYQQPRSESGSIDTMPSLCEVDAENYDINTSNSSVTFHFFAPYSLSVARRESSFDGQHFACFHRFGGVSQSILQLFLWSFC